MDLTPLLLLDDLRDFRVHLAERTVMLEHLRLCGQGGRRQNSETRWMCRLLCGVCVQMWTYIYLNMYKLPNTSLLSDWLDSLTREPSA